MEEIGTSEAGEEAKEAVSRKPRKKVRKTMKDLAPTRSIPRGKTKTHHTVKKDALAVDPDVAKKVRKLRAQLEIKTGGDRVTMSDAIEYALSQCKLK